MRSSLPSNYRLLLLACLAVFAVFSVPASVQGQTPTVNPTAKPTETPTVSPTKKPTVSPTRKPTKTPTIKPTAKPTLSPTKKPTQTPTKPKTNQPTINPTRVPTPGPTNPGQTYPPTEPVTAKPTLNPTSKPTTAKPTGTPTLSPTSKPSGKPTNQPTLTPTVTPTKKPTETPTGKPTGKPTNQPTRGTPSPTGKPVPTVEPTPVPTVFPTRNPTNNPTVSPTRRPTPRPTTEPTKRPTLKPTAGPTDRPTKRPTNKPTFNPTSSPTQAPIFGTRPPTHQPTSEPLFAFELLLFALVPEDTTMTVLEDYIENAAEKFLTGDDDVNFFEVRRDLSYEAVGENSQTDLESFIRVLQEIPNGCTVVDDGTTDQRCVDLGEGRFSYKCGENKGYLCCNKKQGKTIQTGIVVGKCTRNKDIIDVDGVQIDPKNIIAQAREIECLRYDYEAGPGTKCVIVTLTIKGRDERIRRYEEILEKAIEESAFQNQVNIDGLRAAITMFEFTEPPTGTPTARPTVRPSTSPTIVDPCPLLTGNCTGCVMNEECLWCRGNGVCFNSDPVVRGGGGTGPNGVSRLRFLQEVVDEVDEVEVCIGTVSGSESVCNAPTIPPTVAPTINNNTDSDDSSGTSLISAARYSLLSGVLASTILFSLAL